MEPDKQHLEEYGKYKCHLEDLISKIQDEKLKEQLSYRLQSVNNCIAKLK